jgi:hypothetical protein
MGFAQPWLLSPSPSGVIPAQAGMTAGKFAMETSKRCAASPLAERLLGVESSWCLCNIDTKLLALGVSMFSAIHPWMGIALWVIAMPALAAQPFEGSWSENPAWCSNPGMIDEQPIRITSDSLELYVQGCIIKKVKKIANGFQLETVCREEGEEEINQSRYDLSLRGDQMTLLRDDGFKLELQRCPPSDESEASVVSEPKTERGHKQDKNACPTCWLNLNSCTGIFLTRHQIC